MRCDEVRSLLPEHASGGLADPLGLGVETHLAGCPECRAEFAALRGICALLDDTPAPVVQLDAARLREESLHRERRRARRWRRLAVVAMAASVVLAILAVFPRLEIRRDRGQLVIAFGQPQPKETSGADATGLARQADEERFKQLEQLVHALALDAQNREALEQQELVRIQVELERLRQESVRFRLSTEQDVSTLTRYLQQTMKDKGDMP